MYPGISHSMNTPVFFVLDEGIRRLSLVLSWVTGAGCVQWVQAVYNVFIWVLLVTSMSQAGWSSLAFFVLLFQKQFINLKLKTCFDDLVCVVLLGIKMRAFNMYYIISLRIIASTVTTVTWQPSFEKKLWEFLLFIFINTFWILNDNKMNIFTKKVEAASSTSKSRINSVSKPRKFPCNNSLQVGTT